MAEAEPTVAELRLGELIEEFESRRDKDPSLGVGIMREEAGELFDSRCTCASAGDFANGVEAFDPVVFSIGAAPTPLLIRLPSSMMSCSHFGTLSLLISFATVT